MLKVLPHRGRERTEKSGTYDDAILRGHRDRLISLHVAGRLHFQVRNSDGDGMVGVDFRMNIILQDDVLLTARATYVTVKIRSFISHR